jgi:ribonuclease-3
MSEALARLEEKIGYKFRTPDLLRRALTHRSRAFEGATDANSRTADYEQLEFLGDAILGFLISDLLVQRYPSFPEGRLSKLKAWLVSATHLYAAAQKLDLGTYLYLGRGEELSGGRAKRALLSDAVEAIIAAMYLDGGIEPVRNFVLRFIVDDFDPAEKEAELLVVDYKSALQELAQSLGLPAPRYAIVQESGPEHRKLFTVEARVGRDLVERAEGASKKAAGQLAAQRVMQQLLARYSAS